MCEWCPSDRKAGCAVCGRNRRRQAVREWVGQLLLMVFVTALIFSFLFAVFGR